jgi:hypothetical protein
MSYRPTAIIAVLLTLTGCAMPTTPGQQTVSGSPTTPEFNIQPDYKYWMNTIGGRYESDIVPPQPGRLEADITNCYKMALGYPQYEVQYLRTCLILDYTGYKDNQIATHNYRTAGNPFFSLDAAETRWKRYGPLARFSSPDAMFQFLRGSYAFVKPDAINAHPPIMHGQLQEHGQLIAP